MVFTPLALAILVALLLAISWLAWLNPLMFWVSPLVAMSVGFSGLALISSLSDSQGFVEKQILGRWIKWAGGVLLFALLAWYVVPLGLAAWSHRPGSSLSQHPWLADLLSRWTAGTQLSCPNLDPNNPESQKEVTRALRTLQIVGAVKGCSFAAYLLGVYRILKKV